MIEGAQGIPAGDAGDVFNDTNGDLVADSPYDVTLSQQWNTTIAPGASVALETATQFDAEDRAPTAAADAANTGRELPVDVDVLANDGDPDGDPLAVESVTQPQHGTASIQPSGKVRYTPASGYEGSDSFTYTVSDGRGGTASAGVAITVGTYALTLAKTGLGTVRSTPAGIDCGSACSGLLHDRHHRHPRRGSRAGLVLRRLDRRLQRNGDVHGHDERGAVRRRRLPAAAADPR